MYQASPGGEGGERKRVGFRCKPGLKPNLQLKLQNNNMIPCFSRHAHAHSHALLHCHLAIQSWYRMKSRLMRACVLDGQCIPEGLGALQGPQCSALEDEPPRLSPPCHAHLGHGVQNLHALQVCTMTVRCCRADTKMHKDTKASNHPFSCVLSWTTATDCVTVLTVIDWVFNRVSYRIS